MVHYTLNELIRVGVFTANIGRLTEGSVIKKHALDKWRRILGEEHLNIILAMNSLAITLRDLGQLDDAMTLLETIVQRMKRTRSDEHPHTKLTIQNLSRFKAQLTYRTEARPSGSGEKTGGSL